jgi:histidinol phosphatase-like enzyme (inositol monophosphatase family)
MTTVPSAAELRVYREFASSLAGEAGRIGLKYFRTGVEVETKADHTPVTRADRETEQFIRGAIAERFPDHLVTGEEFGSSLGTEKFEGPAGSGPDFSWIIDPIDGTKAFVHGVPLYTTLIALLYRGNPVVGIIHNPVMNETVAASVGGGCTLNEEPCAVSGRAELSDARIHATDFADLYRRKPALTVELLSRSSSARTWADAYGYLLVATGRAEAMIDPVMAPWDIAPLGPIITEAGGRFTSLDGAETWTSGSALATNGHVHDEILRMVGDTKPQSADPST